MHKTGTYHVFPIPPLLEFNRTKNSAIRSTDPENPSLELNMEWIGCNVCEIFAFKLCDLETGVRGHSRSSKVAPFDRAHTTLYPSSIVNMPLSIDKYMYEKLTKCLNFTYDIYPNNILPDFFGGGEATVPSPPLVSHACVQ